LKLSHTYKLIGLIILIGIVSCRPTKNVPEGYYLLNKYKLKCDDKSIDTDELESYIKQKPNKRMLEVFRFHLGVYNMFHKKGSKKLRRKITEIVGEEPVLYDDYLKTKSSKQIKIYLKNKGYYYSDVYDTTIYKKKKAEIAYQVKANKPYTMRNINYNIDDYIVESIVFRDTINSLFKKGKLFDADLMQLERERITKFLKNRGYYDFSKEYIYYEVDSALNSYQVDINVGIKNFMKKISDETYEPEKHHKYTIKNVYIYPNFDPKQSVKEKENYFADFDTLVIENINFIFKKSMKINPKVIINANYIEKNDYYAKYNVDQTYRHLAALKVFKLINIVFTEPDDTKNKYLLDCIIHLTPFAKQSYTAELEGTNSSGNLGIAANLQYQHKSLFNGAEIFNAKIHGGIQQQTTLQSDTENNDEIIDELPFNTIEYGGQTSINIPKFWFFAGNKSYGFTKKYSPKTKVTLSYNYQHRPNYTRTIASLSFGYNWNGTKHTKHIVNPFEVNLVDIPVIDTAFYARIDNPYIKNSYKDYLITSTNYSFIFNNQDLKKKKNHVYFRTNIEPSGNILSTINKITKTTNEGGSYLVMNRKYAQYMKSDIDFRYYQQVYQQNVIAYRVFGGFAYPYGNSTAIPFIKQYFSGGANSIRAWPVRSLGPGSYYNPNEIFNYQTADIKLEANIEYRFKLFWMIEGALFVDAGNIWSITDNDTREGSLFKLNTFYNDIAIGSGFGTRFDFSFFVFRFDFGVKVRDPRQADGEKIVIFTERSKFFKDLFSNVNVGIGYPF